jgi:hypothetical protein
MLSAPLMFFAAALKPESSKLPSFQDVIIPFIVVFLLFAVVSVSWIIRRQRRLVRDDLVNRGLVPGRRHHRHRRHHREERRNPTLAETGGLPPVRAQAAVKVPGIELNANNHD